MRSLRKQRIAEEESEGGAGMSEAGEMGWEYTTASGRE